MILLRYRVTNDFHDLHASDHDLLLCFEDIKDYSVAFVVPCVCRRNIARAIDIHHEEFLESIT